MIAIIDYAINNLRSVEKAFQSLGVDVLATNAPEEIRKADKIVLPGVGAFADAMSNLKAKNLDGVIREKVEAGTPLLGLCLGLQLLFSESEEFGRHSGLNFVPGKVVRIPAGLKVPHIGWNQLHIKRPDPLLKGIEEGSFVYFVHSYYADSAKSGRCLGDLGLRHRVSCHHKPQECLGHSVSPGKEPTGGSADPEEFCRHVGSP